MVIAGEVFVGEEVHDCWEICSWNLWTKLNSRAGKHLNRPREGPVVKLYTWDLAILQQDWHKILYVNAIDVENLPPFPFISPLTYSVWPPLLIFHWLIQCDHPSLFSTDLFSVTIPPYFPLTYSVWRVSGQCVGTHGWVAGIASHGSNTSPQGPWYPTSIRQCRCLIIFKSPLYRTASLPCTVCGWLIKHSQFSPLQDLVIWPTQPKILYLKEQEK